MRKLDLFRIIGESLARSSDFPMGNIGKRKVDDRATRFFENTVHQMYPRNMHRQEWALANLELFYTHECERIQIMNKLSDRKVSPSDILDEIRSRRDVYDADGVS